MKKLFKAIKKNRAVVLGAGALSSAGAAMADGVDVSTVVTTITAAGVAIGTIGLAVLGVKFGAKLYRWVSSAG